MSGSGRPIVFVSEVLASTRRGDLEPATTVNFHILLDSYIIIILTFNAMYLKVWHPRCVCRSRNNNDVVRRHATFIIALAVCRRTTSWLLHAICCLKWEKCVTVGYMACGIFNFDKMPITGIIQHGIYRFYSAVRSLLCRGFLCSWQPSLWSRNLPLWNVKATLHHTTHRNTSLHIISQHITSHDST